MKLNKKQLKQFDTYVEELGRELKYTVLWESSDKYLRQQCEFKYDSFLINYIERYMNIEYDSIKNDMKLKSRFDKILFSVLKDMREELKVEHEKRIKEERKRENFYSQYRLQERIKVNPEDLTNDNEKNNMSNEVIQEKEQGGENAKE